MELLLSHYGPFAFGVVAMLVIWIKVVRPELRASREHVAAVTACVHGLKTTAEQLQEVSGALTTSIERLRQSQISTERVFHSLTAKPAEPTHA